jgi:aspartate-semialdehyde dehydrogenase
MKKMGETSFEVRNPKIPVTILGATGSVGQRFVSLLADHPYFEIASLRASAKSEGKEYREATSWLLPTPLPEKIGKMQVKSCAPDGDARFAFSALSSDVAGELETAYAEKGCIVISTAKNHRMDASVPMVIPEVNGDHLKLVKGQQFTSGGMIVTKPNCSVIGLSLALCPLDRTFGIQKVHVVTMQSASGAGYPGVPSLALFDNIIPFIDGEEEKMEKETKKI